jgi:hypothetical protein
MANRLYWKADPSVTVTSFVITRSTDLAQSFSALATVNYDLAGANYDKRTKKFFYDDSTGSNGNVYRIVAVGNNGTSTPVFLVAPAAAPSTCTIIGYIMDTFAEVNTSLQVHVESYGRPQWKKGTSTLVAQSAEALGVPTSEQIVTPNTDGVWQVRLVQGAYAKIRIPDLQYDHAFLVPEKEGPVNIRDIPFLRQADLHGLYPDQSVTQAGIPRA